MEQEWIKTITKQLAPKFGEFASDVLSCQVEPLVQKTLQSTHLPNVNFKFEKMDFGDVPPEITNMHTHGSPEGQDVHSVTVDFDVTYLGNCDLQVSIMGIHSGVQDLQVSGKARVVMKPTTKTMPLVGGIQVFFLEQPQIGFNLDGIADICDWSPIRRKMRKAIQDDTANRCVYPNRLIMPLSDSLDAMAIKSFEPTGILRVQLLRATGLPKKGGIRSLIGQDKPDAYGKIRLGANLYCTTVVKNTTDPEWSEDQWFDYMLETPNGHRVKVELYDEDSLSRDDFLGNVYVNVQDVLEDTSEVELALEDDASENDGSEPAEISGQVTLRFSWNLLNPCTSLNPETPTLLTLFVYSCNNLIVEDSDSWPTTRLDISVCNQMKQSQIKKNSAHPNFEEGFTFLFAANENWSEESLNITVHEADTGGNFGTFTLPLSNLVDNPMKRKVVSIDEERPQLTITLAANLKCTN